MLCYACDEALPRLGNACRQCALPIYSGELCGRCLRKPPLITQSVAPFRYESWTKSLIHRFKFDRDLRVGRFLSACLARHVQQAYRDSELPKALVAVPLHSQRLYERGFNQAIELAKPLSTQFSMPLFLTAAERVQHAGDQIGLSALARRRNVRGVFRIVQSLPDHIAIVDDVVTTGATVLEMAKQAKKHGAQRIDVWCVARTVSKLN